MSEPRWRRRRLLTIHLLDPSGARWRRDVLTGEDPVQVVRWLYEGLGRPLDLTWWVTPQGMNEAAKATSPAPRNPAG